MWRFICACVFVWSVSTQARAEPQAGDLKVSLLGAIASLTTSVASLGAPEPWRVGLFVDGMGVEFGYVAHAHFTPKLLASVEMDRWEVDGATWQRYWELRPALEVPFRLTQRLVPFISAGPSLGREVVPVVVDGSDIVRAAAFLFGGAAELGIHVFAAQDVSLDLAVGVRFQRVWGIDPSELSGHDVSISAREQDWPPQFAGGYFVTLGGSFWP